MTTGETVPQTAREVEAWLSPAVDAAFRAYTAEAQGQRDDLYALTMSGLGGCTRHAAYRISRTPPSEEMVFTEMREANIGTMIHEGLLPHLATIVQGTDEIAVVLRLSGLEIHGRSDLVVAGAAVVADLKTVGSYKFAALDPSTVNRAHRLQVAGYATAVRQAGGDVRWIAWIYLDRASGQHEIVVEEFGDELVALVEQRCAELALFAEDPEAAPREERGPGLSIICDGCPWLRTCWGEGAEAGVVGAQKILAHDNAGVAKALELYDDARAREKEATADKEFARAMFSERDPGAYGGYQFGWSAGSKTTDDKDAAVRLLAEVGIPIPQKTVGRRLIVKRARQPEG